MIEDYGARSRGAVSFTVQGEPRPLAPETHLALQRVAQEALANVCKHANNAPVQGSLVYRSDAVELTIRNRTGNGDSRWPDSSFGAYGLKGMSERAQLLRPQGRPDTRRLGNHDARARVSSRPARVRVIIADDQTAVREGLVTLLGLLAEIEIVGAAADGAEALQLVEKLQPDVVLMDLRMPRLDGVEATRRIRDTHSGTQVVVLTTYADDDSVLQALQAGARGYLTKDAGRAEIGRAIQAVAAGQTLLEPAIQERLLAAATTGSAARRPRGELPDGLTQRESEVLSLVAAGNSNAQIAAQLFVSETTVKSHINHIFRKTQVRDRAAAVHYAYEHGLVSARPDPSVP